MMRQVRFAIIILLLALVSAAVNVGAATIGINFAASHSVLSTDEPGIVAGANWNNIEGASGTDLALQDDTATLLPFTQLTFSSTEAFPSYSGTITPNAGTNQLYRGGLVGNNLAGEVSITVTDVPYAMYDVYVFASQDTSVTNTLSITDGTTTFYYRSNGQANNVATSLRRTTSTNSLNPTRGPAQYQVFKGLTAPSFTLDTAGSISGVISNNVFGLHIVEVSPHITAQFLIVRSAVKYSRSTGTFRQTVKITNNGAAVTAAAYVLDDLPGGVEVVMPMPVGTTSAALPAGSPYIELGPIGAGDTVQVILEFTRMGTTPIVYTPRVLGDGPR